MKFNDYSSLRPIIVQLQLFQDRVVLLVTNAVEPVTVEPFKVLIQEIITSDPSEMLIHQLERNADAKTDSGVGILTMINDYSAKIGWKFEITQEDPKVITVTTRVQLAI